MVYCSEFSESGKRYAYVCEDEQTAVKIIDDIDTMYVSDEDIFYLSYESIDFIPVLHKYNMSDKTDEVIFTFDEYSNICDLMIEGDYAVFYGIHNDADEASVFKINLKAEKNMLNLYAKAKPRKMNMIYAHIMYMEAKYI